MEGNANEKMAGFALRGAAARAGLGRGDAGAAHGLYPGHVADPANYTENGYEDETLSVTMERVWVGGCAV